MILSSVDDTPEMLLANGELNGAGRALDRFRHALKERTSWQN